MGEALTKLERTRLDGIPRVPIGMLTFVGDNIVYTGHAGQFAIPRLADRVTEYRPRPILATAAGWIILALDDERTPARLPGRTG